MAVSAAEKRFILDQLGRRAKEDMVRLWDAAGRTYGNNDEFVAFLVEAFPDLVDEFQQTAAQLAATVFEEDFPNLTPVVAEPLPRERLQSSMQWALGAFDREALDRLDGTIQRAIYDGERETTVLSAQANGMRWIRQARPGACAFCRMLATRTDFDNTYRSAVLNPLTGEYETRVVGRSVNLSLSDRRQIQAGNMTREEALARQDEIQRVYQISRRGKFRRGDVRTRRLRGDPAGKKLRTYGDKYHDDCRCTAKAVPAGIDVMDYLYSEEPDYATQVDVWRNEYIKASTNAAPKNEFGAGDPKAILAEWRTFGDDIA